MLQKTLIYPKLSYKITGLCFEAHNELGRFAREKQYADRLEQLMLKNDVKYQRETLQPFRFGQNTIKGNILDFLIEDVIILEVKAKRFITKDDYQQIQRYLRATNLRLGLLVNFRSHYLKPKRVINYLHKSN